LLSELYYTIGGKMLEHTAMKPLTALDHPDFVAGFFYFIYQGDTEALEELLTVPMINIDVLSPEGMTGLGIAAQYGLTDVIAILLKNKANVNAKDNIGRTALLIAVKNERHAVTEQLLVYGADPELADNALNTPLSCALDNRSLPILKILLQYNTDPHKTLQNGPYSGFTPLAATYGRDCFQMFAILCQKGANIPSAANSKLLIKIANWGRLDYLELMWPQAFDKKVDVIINAILYNKINILKYALAHTTNEERQKAFHTLIGGVSPLTYSFNHRQLKAARLLLDHGHELVQRDNKASEEAVIIKFPNKEWHSMLEDYFNNIKQHEQTPTLTEMSANKVYQSAINTKTPIKDLGLPLELEALCYLAPPRLHIQSTLKPQHVKDFLNDLFNQSESDIAESARKIKRKNHKRAKGQ
jgi:ankyrin repeat protein